MPRYEFTAWVTVKAPTEDEAKREAERACGLVEEHHGAAILSLDDSEPLELDDEDDED